jgi:hypothetical protein
MKKILLTISALFIVISFLQAQEETKADTVKYWKKGGFTSANINQVSLSNWAAGGDNSFSITLLGNGFANYKKGKSTWDNSIDMGYGLIRNGGVEKFRKNEDKIDFVSKFGHQVNKKGHWFYSALVNFKSQFAPGFNYPNDSIAISRFLAPGFLMVALGMDYKPVDYISIFMSPATGKFTFVMDQKLADAGAFGVQAAVFDPITGALVTKGQTFRPEFGAYISANFQKDVMKNINLRTKLDLFNNYTDKNKPNRKNIDVNWEMMISMKVNKYIGVSLFSHLIYDDDINIPVFSNINGVQTQTGFGPRLQFKQVSGVGFSYKF